jgi:hypothetical protein
MLAPKSIKEWPIPSFSCVSLLGLLIYPYWCRRLNAKPEKAAFIVAIDACCPLIDEMRL